MPNGTPVHAYTLSNYFGASVKIITLGATIVSINVPDKNDNFADVVCGYDDVDSYLNNSGYQGAIIGRYGNRIKNSSFVLDGIEYKLFNNEGNNHLHGCKEGFYKKNWDAKAWEICNSMYLEMSYFSPDMEEGYPGNLNVKVLYSFDHNNTLSINYKAATDKKTVLNKVIIPNRKKLGLFNYLSARLSFALVNSIFIRKTYALLVGRKD
jgi:aldose 1-epimerase